MATAEERRAQNEAAFRDANEEIDAAIEAHAYDAELAPFVCECGDADCRELLRVPLATYRDVRSVATRFIVAGDGHATGDGTEIVDRHEGFLVVEKHGLAGEVARERAPD